MYSRDNFHDDDDIDENDDNDNDGENYRDYDDVSCQLVRYFKYAKTINLKSVHIGSYNYILKT